MKILVLALKEIFGLFVDDGALALGTLGIAGLVAAGAQMAIWPQEWTGPALFAALAALLSLSAWRAARR